MKIDHVTIAGPVLDELMHCFAQAGLTADAGGRHSNNVTHMAVVGFDDGSYIELISTIEPAARSPWWDAHIRGGAGPCGWAIEVNGVASEVQRLTQLGIPVRGPLPMHRMQPGGQRVAWELAIPGTGAPGVLLPFAIADVTPRQWRVQPSKCVKGTSLAGIAAVVIGIADLAGAERLFAKSHSLAPPRHEVDSRFGATLARYDGAPIILASPLDRQNWLGQRLLRFGPCPCAYLLRATDIDDAMTRWPLKLGDAWFGRDVAWFNAASLGGIRLGVTV